MIWNLSFCKLIDWRTLWLHNTRFNPFPDWICRWGHFAVLGRALGWGHHWYWGHSLSYYSNAALLILFYPVKDREDGEAGSCWTAKLVHGKLQGKRTVKVPCKGKGSRDREVKEMGQMEECMSWEAWKGKMSLPKTGKILMRSRKCPVTRANNRICVLLHPWEIPLYKAFILFDMSKSGIT